MDTAIGLSGQTTEPTGPLRPTGAPEPVPAPSPPPAAATGGSPARRRPRLLSAGVAVLLLAITAGLTVLAWQANARSEQRLLNRQLDQVGSLLTNQAAVLRTEMADIGTVAVNTNANPAAFAHFAAGELKQTGQSLTLWRLGGGTATQLAAQGVDPWLPADGPGALAGLKPDGKLVIVGILPGRDGKPDRLAYALMPPAPNTDLLVYAESPLPPGHRIPATPDSPLAGLDLALYLGATTNPAHLLEATAPTPITGHTGKTTVPFGTAKVTVVGASPTSLTGTMSTALPWIMLGVGVLLAAAGVATLEIISRRRAHAELLAAENAALYREQRGIAGTLQHALLPAVPTVAGLQVAARYLPGVDSLDVGGDWYDVIEHRPGCVVFVVGDVSGHGLPAATTMAALRFALRGFVSDGHDIAGVLTRLRRLLDIDTEHQFATVLLGELDLSTRRLRLVSAGHLPPVLIADGAAQLLPCPPAPPVGVTDPTTPQVIEVQLPAAGILLAYSDGLVERRGEVLDAGLDRLRSAAAAADSRPLAPLLDDLLAELTAHAGRKDDTVLLGLQWTR